jgi:hypothetical protein
VPGHVATACCPPQGTGPMGWQHRLPKRNTPHQQVPTRRHRLPASKGDPEPAEGPGSLLNRPCSLDSLPGSLPFPPLAKPAAAHTSPAFSCSMYSCNMCVVKPAASS